MQRFERIILRRQGLVMKKVLEQAINRMRGRQISFTLFNNPH